MNRRCLMLLLAATLLVLLPSCGGSAATATPLPPSESATQQPTSTATVPATNTPEPTPAPAAEVQLLKATFAHGLTEEMRPEDPGSDFYPDETVYLALEIKGRPKSGVIAIRFYWNDDLIIEGGYDLADVNAGVIFSIGENTFVGFDFTHKKPLLVGGGYRAEVFYDDEPLGTYDFRVIPPKGAIASEIRDVTLAKGVDEDYNPVELTETFSPEDTVHLVGRGEFGIATWVQAEWYVSGEYDEAGTRSITAQENISDTGLYFSYLPDGGWPKGKHAVVLRMNNEEVGRYEFTVE